MITKIQYDDIIIDVVRKKIKHLYLRIHPPAGRVTVSAPQRMPMYIIREFIESRMPWIKTHQQRIRERPPVPAPEPDNSLHLWGKRYELHHLNSTKGAPSLELREDRVVLHARPTTSQREKRAAIATWYHQHLSRAIPPLISQWEQTMGVKASRVTIRQMRTRWGSCTPGSGAIRLSLELAKKPLACLEYVIVHELVHLMEPSHNKRFYALMDKFLADWRSRREELNRLTSTQ